MEEADMGATRLHLGGAYDRLGDVVATGTPGIFPAIGVDNPEQVGLCGLAFQAGAPSHGTGCGEPALAGDMGTWFRGFAREFRNPMSGTGLCGSAGLARYGICGAGLGYEGSWFG